MKKERRKRKKREKELIDLSLRDFYKVARRGINKLAATVAEKTK